MVGAELIVGIVLVAVLVILAVVFSYKQGRTLRNVQEDPTLPHEDRRYLRAQVKRRLACSVLMVVFAGMLIGWFFLAGEFERIQPVDPEDPGKPEGLRFYTMYWIAAMLVLLGMMTLALFDFLSTARYGFHKRRRLEADHRQILEEEAARLRKQNDANDGGQFRSS